MTNVTRAKTKNKTCMCMQAAKRTEFAFKLLDERGIEELGEVARIHVRLW